MADGAPVAKAIRFGRYELLRCIAAGGMGEVFLARQAGAAGFEKLLVIKVLLPHLVRDPQFVQMFLEEARIAAQLNHPNVAQIFDLGQAEGAYFIAMEHVHGVSLAQVLRAEALRGSRLPMPLAARLVADAASGLDYAHAARDAAGRPLDLVHRDVSPQNVLVSFDGGVKIIDFGIAKAAGRLAHTETGTLRGKIPYMSPEQVGGHPLDRRSDVFALGVVLFELLTGRRLFKGETDLETLSLVARGEIPRPSEVDPDVPPGLEEIVLAALARDRDRRTPTAGALRDALEGWLAHGGSACTCAEVGRHLRQLFASQLQAEQAAGGPAATEDGLRSSIFRGVGPAVQGRPPWRAVASAAAGVAVALGLVVGAVQLGRPDPQATARPPGALRVNTTPPGASVFVDGRPVGTTPLLEVPLDPGSTAVVSLALAGYQRVERRVEGAGRHTLELTLQPDAPPAAPEPPAPSPTLEPAARPAVAGEIPMAPEARRLYDGAVQFMASGKWAQANTALRQAAKVDPRHPFIQENLGVSYRMVGDYRSATEALERAAELGGQASAHYNLACVRALSLEPKRAIEALREAVARGFGDPDLGGDKDLASLRHLPEFSALENAAARNAAAPPAATPAVAPEPPSAEEARASPAPVAPVAPRAKRARPKMGVEVIPGLGPDGQIFDPTLPPSAHLARGRAFESEGLSYNAMREYEEYLHLSPDAPEAKWLIPKLRDYFAQTGHAARYPLR